LRKSRVMHNRATMARFCVYVSRTLCVMRTFSRASLIFISGAVCALILLGAAAVYAWTGPTASPPGNNASAPINVSATAQTKSGALTVTSGVNAPAPGGYQSLGNYGGTGSAAYFPSGLWSNGASAWIYGTVYTDGAIYQDGQLRMDDGGGWIRTYGTSGWYNGTYAGGWYMADSTYIRNYNGRYVYLDSNFYAPIMYDQQNTGYFVDPSAVSYVNDIRAYVYYDLGDPGFYMVPRSSSRMNAITANAFYYASDARLKTNVKRIENSLWKLLQLKGVEFTWNEKAGDRAGTHDIGVIAQDVEKVIPEAVHIEQNGTKVVDYPRLVPLLINAIQEQQTQIDELRKEIEALKTK
jgi:hypothetical protein